MAMQKITTLVPIRLSSGKVKLTKEQARRRQHLLGDNKGSTYDLEELGITVHFKAGEEFSYSGEIPKGWIDNMVEIAGVKKPERSPSKPKGLGGQKSGEKAEGPAEDSTGDNVEGKIEHTLDVDATGAPEA